MKVFSVTEITKHIKDMFLREAFFFNIYVKGEISNFKLHYSGHMYFTLKDELCAIRCVMFRSNCQSLKFLPDNGMNIVAKGSVSVFERDGQYQLYVEEIQPDGIGALHVAFEQLKSRLQSEGLFDENRKKNLPFMPTKIGVVTSSDGAVIRDIISVASRRFYNIQIKVFPVSVQGEFAASQISKAIELANTLECVDVIIIARGGGSLEELWAFNEEIVARSIASSKIPVVSAVGHETDYTIADFVSDLRAPTPSAAAEMIIPEKSALKYTIGIYAQRLKAFITGRMAAEKSRFESLKSTSVFRHPYDLIYQQRMKLDILERDMAKNIQAIMSVTREKIKGFYGKLDALSPLAILARGYSISSRVSDGMYIKSINDVGIKDRIEIRVSDGKIKCSVESTEDVGNDEV